MESNDIDRRSKLLRVPKLLATPTVVTDSRLGSLSLLTLQKHCSTVSGGKGLEVVLVNDFSIGKGNGVGTLASLSVYMYRCVTAPRAATSAVDGD